MKKQSTLYKRSGEKKGRQSEFMSLLEKTKDSEHYQDIAWLGGKGHKSCQVWNQII